MTPPVTPAATADSRPLGVGIVGYGKVGRTRAECLAGRGDARLVHVSDLDAAAAPPGVRFSADHRAVVADPAVDAVFVCAFNSVAAEVVEAALDAGKHVFCEKPPGRSVADVERMIAAERRNPGRVLKFGFNHRYHYGVVEAKAIVDSGHLGRPLWLRGVYGKSGGDDFPRIWRSDPTLAGGGILLDQGIHMLDLFRLFCGDFVDVRSVVRTMFWDIPLEDNAFAILTSAAGQVALLHSSATQWKHRFTLEICLEQGYVNLNGILSSTRSYGDESLTYARRPGPGDPQSAGRPREEVIFFDRDDSWALEVDDFLAAARAGRPVADGTSADALKAMQLVEAIYRNGGRGAG
ncbi:Gfo/Idh/MocA family protein [Azospirillum sp. ST 5-10]|uniref:Gfo/Idh/MocA family protein n=1 Tax=unclassified Azospirillum TaxID=2630922 RepID=UPI003F49FC75